MACKARFCHPKTHVANVMTNHLDQDSSLRWQWSLGTSIVLELRKHLIDFLPLDYLEYMKHFSYLKIFPCPQLLLIILSVREFFPSNLPKSFMLQWRFVSSSVLSSKREQLLSSPLAFGDYYQLTLWALLVQTKHSRQVPLAFPEISFYCFPLSPFSPSLQWVSDKTQDEIFGL